MSGVAGAGAGVPGEADEPPDPPPPQAVNNTQASSKALRRIAAVKGKGKWSCRIDVLVR
jgi:hypothetical protein